MPTPAKAAVVAAILIQAKKNEDVGGERRKKGARGARRAVGATTKVGGGIEMAIMMIIDTLGRRGSMAGSARGAGEDTTMTVPATGLLPTARMMIGDAEKGTAGRGRDDDRGQDRGRGRGRGRGQDRRTIKILHIC